ncbi:MAG TPA: DUF3482 domain-containing protein [Sutterella sp.]|nr:DUF3482 domain-containing protein [Sutterella sp.]
MAKNDILRIHLSLISHTNIGKTTLARTLLGRDVGTIEDRPHVTLENEDYVLIRATDGCSELVLWDTPGFGDSVRLAKRLEGRSNPIGWFVGEVWDRVANKVLWLNQKILRHVKVDTTVVLYLVNASESPKLSDYVASEMQILAWIGKPVIVLLNQMGKPREPDKEEADVELWRTFLADYPLVKKVLPMDAFARCWVQEYALFDAIAQTLDADTKETFEGLQEAWSRQRRATYRSAVGAIGSYLARLRLEHEAVSELSFTEQVKDLGRHVGIVKTEDGPVADAKNALASRAAQALSELTEKLINIYDIEGKSAKREILRRVKRDWTIHTAANPKSAAILGAIGTGAASGIAADLMTGGLSLGLGALLGTVVGAIGGYGAAFGINKMKGLNGNVISWSREALDNFFLESVLLYLAVSHFGRGRGFWVESEAPAFWKDLVIEELKRQDKRPDLTAITNPDEIEAAATKIADTVIRNVLYTLYKRTI